MRLDSIPCTPPVEIIGTGLVYRNPKPHVHSQQAYFPSVALLPNGDLLCTLVLGEAFEAVNCHTHVARSTDGGATWRLEGPIYVGTPERLTSDGSRIVALPDGEVVAFMVRSDRADHPQEALSDPENLGFVPTETLLLRSTDFGKSWSAPASLEPPRVGPSFELCCPIIPLSHGRWLLPTSTWRGWDGYCPNGLKMVAFVSHDRGASWPEYVDVMRDPHQRIFYWESKIAELPDGRLLAIAWAYDHIAGHDLPNQYAISRDGGRTWSTPRSTELERQTLTPHILDDRRILCVYRSMDKPGLWANLSHLEGGEWINDGD